MFTKTNIIFRKIFQNSKVNKSIYVANKKKYNETTSNVVINKIITRKMHTTNANLQSNFGGGNNNNNNNNNQPILWLIAAASATYISQKYNSIKNISE